VAQFDFIYQAIQLQFLRDETTSSASRLFLGPLLARTFGFSYEQTINVSRNTAELYRYV
jgi:hypothetical protein